MKKTFFITLLLLGLMFETYAQKRNNYSFNLNVGYGYVAPINDFVKGINVDNKKVKSMACFDLQISKTIDGSKPWHNRYKGYTYGVGLFHGIFNYSKNIGNPFGLYGFISFAPIDNQHFKLSTQMAVGLSFPWKGYSQENYYQVAVSSKVESYIHARMTGLYKFNDNIALGLSGSFIHFSNGTISRPNKGLNIISPSISLVYTPEKIIQQHCPEQIDFTPKWRTYINTYGAIKGTFVDYYNKDLPGDTSRYNDTVRQSFAIYGVQLRLQRQLTFSHSVGLGVDISYNGTIGRTNRLFYINGRVDTLSYWDKTTISVFGAYEYSINKFSIFIEPIFYLKKMKNTYFPEFAQRLGFKYYLTDHILAQVSVRAYEFHMADYIEWGLGYRF